MRQPTRRLALQHLLASGAATATWPVLAQGTTPHSVQDLAMAQRLIEVGLKDEVGYRTIESLCTEVGARPAGSVNDARAVIWALDTARRGKPFPVIKAEPVPLIAWARGPAQATLMAPHARPLAMLALGNSIGTVGDGIDAPLAYYPNLAALKAETSDKPKGKVVFIDERTDRTPDGSGYGRAVLARAMGAVEAARRGAVAVAIRSIGTDRDRLAHTGAMRYDPAVAMIPAIAVSVPDADLIERLHGTGTPMRLQLKMQNTSGIQATSHNVILDIPGTDLKDEVVLMGGHLDSWDVGQGAIDDAAGVGISMAAARLLLTMQFKPRRTIRVVLFANEENGFDGARAYAKNHAGTVHQMVSESDFGAGKVWRLRSRVAESALPAIDNLAKLLAPLGVKHDGNQGHPGADAGVLMRTHPWPAMELTQDGTNYFDLHHTENDTFDKIDKASVQQNVACWAATAWLAAQSQLPFGPLARA